MAPRSALAWLVGVVLVAAACSSGTTASTARPTDDAWRTTALVDTRSGEAFTIAELKGKLVVVEPMAIWCSNCRIQQGKAAVALDRIDDPDIVYLSVDVDPNERAGDLAAYADGSGVEGARQDRDAAPVRPGHAAFSALISALHSQKSS